MLQRRANGWAPLIASDLMMRFRKRIPGFLRSGNVADREASAGLRARPRRAGHSAVGDGNPQDLSPVQRRNHFANGRGNRGKIFVSTT